MLQGDGAAVDLDVLVLHRENGIHAGNCFPHRSRRATGAAEHQWVQETTQPTGVQPRHVLLLFAELRKFTSAGSKCILCMEKMASVSVLAVLIVESGSWVA